jgi:hypothetical protein
MSRMAKSGFMLAGSWRGSRRRKGKETFVRYKMGISAGTSGQFDEKPSSASRFGEQTLDRGHRVARTTDPSCTRTSA